MTEGKYISAGFLRELLVKPNRTRRENKLCDTMVWYNILTLNDTDPVTDTWRRNLPMFCIHYIRGKASIAECALP